LFPEYKKNYQLSQKGQISQLRTNMNEAVGNVITVADRIYTMKKALKSLRGNQVSTRYQQIYKDLFFDMEIAIEKAWINHEVNQSRQMLTRQQIKLQNEMYSEVFSIRLLLEVIDDLQSTNLTLTRNLLISFCNLVYHSVIS
jgi:hypothetical protein